MTKIEAEKVAKILIKKLGKGWKPYVMENAGWHCGATRGPINVHVSKHPGERLYYWAMVADEPNPTHHYGAMAWTAPGNTHSRDPRTAVKKAIEPVIRYVARVNNVLRECADAVRAFK